MGRVAMMGIVRGACGGFFPMNYDAKIDPMDGSVTADAVSHERGSLDDSDRFRRGFSPRLIIFAAIALAALVAIWFVTRSDKPAVDPEAAIQIPVVSVVAPGRTTVSGEINATGTLAARRDLQVGSVGEGGRVVSVLVDDGDWVKQGQVLAVIDRSVQSQQIASQAAQVQVAEADARLAQSNLDRALQLVERGFISKADVDRLTATRDAANARVRVARATLGQLNATAARLNITAPANGLILDRSVEPGQVVSGGSGMLFRIARDGEMELQTALSEDDLAKLSVGVTAQVTPVGSSRTFTGQVWQVSPIIDPDSRQGQARIALGYSPELRPGGFASAKIASGTVVAPVLPESAILSDEKGPYVFVVGKDGLVHRRAIRTGMVTAQGIVVNQGLDGSERIVLRAGGFLAEGDKVKVDVVKPGPAKPGT